MRNVSIAKTKRKY